MRVRCGLREIREAKKRGLRELALEIGVNPGTLSQIERGERLPDDELIPALEEAYGAPAVEWYPPSPAVLVVAIEPDTDGRPT